MRSEATEVKIMGVFDGFISVSFVCPGCGEKGDADLLTVEENETKRCKRCGEYIKFDTSHYIKATAY